MKALIVIFYSHEDTRRVLKLNTTVLYSTVHSTKKPQTLNVEKKNPPSLMKQKSMFQGQECSPQGILLLTSAHLFKISQGKAEAQFGHISPTLLSNPHAHLCTCASQLIMLPYNLGSGSKLFPNCTGETDSPKSCTMTNWAP